MTLRPLGRDLTFRLNRKKQHLGRACVDPVWVPIPELYGNPRVAAERGNHSAICRGYWDLCRANGTSPERDAGESYLLARLTPFTRSVGSQRIFPDGRLGYAGRSFE